MNRKLVNVWEHNQELIDTLADTFKGDSYHAMLFDFATMILGLSECIDETGKDCNVENFRISGIYKDYSFNTSYKITIFGSLEYGSCSECDLMQNIYDYGYRDKTEAIKLILLNILQAAKVEVESSDSNILNSWRNCEESWTTQNDELYETLALISFYIMSLEDKDIRTGNKEKYYSILLRCMFNDPSLTHEEAEQLRLYTSSIRKYPIARMIDEIIHPWH